MSWRFLRRITIIPGLRLNIGKRGVSVSAGRRGAWLTAGLRGITGTIGIPGSGLRYTKSASYKTITDKVEATAANFKSLHAETGSSFSFSSENKYSIQIEITEGEQKVPGEGLAKYVKDSEILKSLNCLNGARLGFALALMALAWLLGIAFVPAVPNEFAIIFLVVYVIVPPLLALKILRRNIRYPKSEPILQFEHNRANLLAIAQKGHLHLIGKPENWKFQQGKFRISNPFRGPQSNVKPLMGKSNDGTAKFWLYPDFLLVYRVDVPGSEKWAFFRFDQINILESSARIDDVPKKINFGTLLSERVTHITKAGEPDKRFKDNPLLYSYEVPLAGIVSEDNILLALACSKLSVRKIVMDIFSNPQGAFD